MKGALNGLLAVISLVLAAGSFYFYRSSGTTLLFVAFIIFLILTLLFAGLFLSGKMNKTEEIHITE